MTDRWRVKIDGGSITVDASSDSEARREAIQAFVEDLSLFSIAPASEHGSFGIERCRCKLCGQEWLNDTGVCEWCGGREWAALGPQECFAVLQHREADAVLELLKKALNAGFVPGIGLRREDAEAAAAKIQVARQGVATMSAVAKRTDEPPTHRWQRPNVAAPLIVWEYAFALERNIEDLQARLKDANGHA